MLLLPENDQRRMLLGRVARGEICTRCHAALHPPAQREDECAGCRAVSATLARALERDLRPLRPAAPPAPPPPSRYEPEDEIEET